MVSCSSTLGNKVLGCYLERGYLCARYWLIECFENDVGATSIILTILSAIISDYYGLTQMKIRHKLVNRTRVILWEFPNRHSSSETVKYVNKL